jgi:hypothetical protein
MEFPKFKNDAEMAEWFEANDVEAEDLEPANVVIADDLIVTLAASSEFFSLTPAPATSAASVANDRNPELTSVA